MQKIYDLQALKDAEKQKESIMDVGEELEKDAEAEEKETRFAANDALLLLAVATLLLVIGWCII